MGDLNAGYFFVFFDDTATVLRHQKMWHATYKQQQTKKRNELRG
jgi:hypothetical protein